MILDSSALVAIILAEPGYQQILETIKANPQAALGAPTLVETLIVLTARLHGDPVPALKELLRAIEAEVIPFTEDHSYVALKTYSRFGKGRHPAALNFGDCLSYAVAAVAQEPLLYVGNDFSLTDVLSA